MLPHRSLARLLVLIVCCAAGLAVAAEPPMPADDLHQRFPPASIDSVAKADAALAATSGAKERVDKDYKNAARACLKQVLVNICMDGARTQRRTRMADIDAIELEANRFKRRDKADHVEADRARREADAAGKATADAEQRARNRKGYEDRQAEAARAAADRATSAAKRADPANQSHRPVIKMAPPKPIGADAAQRAKNAAEYDARVKAAQVHRVELDRRLAEKTIERKRRADAKAVKDAKDARTAAAAAAAAGSKP